MGKRVARINQCSANAKFKASEFRKLVDSIGWEIFGEERQAMRHYPDPIGPELNGFQPSLALGCYRRMHWPATAILIRGDSHYGRMEAMEWCERNGVDYIFGLGPNKVLAEQVFPWLDEICVQRAIAQADKVRGFTVTRYAAKSWSRTRRVVARIEATTKGADVRYVVTNLTKGSAQHLYEKVYCARGQAENLIKRHKSQLVSDRTSCRSPLANQMRLIPHTTGYWLMRLVRDAIPKAKALANGEFSTIRNRLLKIAVRVRETGTRIKLAFAANCPDVCLFRTLIAALVLRPT